MKFSWLAITALLFSVSAQSSKKQHFPTKCLPLQENSDAPKIWAEFSHKFGEVRLPQGVVLCYGDSAFAEVPGGAGMQSVLDRKRLRILLRRDDAQLLRHELAHLYLDLRWKVLPYPVAEVFAKALAYGNNCQLSRNPPPAGMLANRWQQRLQMHECELQQLLLDVLCVDSALRESLPLR